MIGFGKKTKSEVPNVRRPGKPQSKQKVHSYYTSQQVDIEVSNGKKRRKVTRENILKTSFFKRLAVVMFVVFVILTASVLSDEPIISFYGGQKITNVDRYSQYIQGLLGSSVLNTNKFTLQSDKLSSMIVQQFPEISTVSVSTVVLGKKPLVRLSLYNLPITFESNGEKYAVAENGSVVGFSADFPLQKNTILVKDESGITVAKSDVVIRSDDVEFISTVKSILTAQGRALEYVRLTSVPREIFVKTKDKNYEIRMYLDDDVIQQTGSWFAVEEVVGESGESITKYIDVRAGEKVYWQ